jgi:hypothetical protein
VLAYSKYTLVIILTILLVFLPSGVNSQGVITCEYETGSDCNQWWDYVRIYDDGSFVGSYMLDAGGWSDPYTIESVVVSGSSPCQHIPPITIYEPSNCLKTSVGSCKKTARYHMFTLEDENQPPEWQRYCYVISNNGIPSVESQARVCSVPGYDHVYKATNIPYGGWVSTDCRGNASYGWPDWQPSWYRPSFAK